MSDQSVCVVGSEPTMVYDAVHNVVAELLGDLDPSVALEDFTAKDVTSSGGESLVTALVAALNTPPFLVARRVVVVRDAQLLVSGEVAVVAQWMAAPAPDTFLVVAVVGPRSHRFVKAAARVVEVNVGSRPADRVKFVTAKMLEYGVVIDSGTAQRVAAMVGEDVARVDALARTLRSVYGSAPLTFARVEPYLGEAGDVPVWDLTDAIDGGDVTLAVTVARRMLDSRRRAALQLVAALERHYLNVARLEGDSAHTRDEAAAILGISAYPAEKALAVAKRLGPSGVARAVRWITEADLALKGELSYGGRDLERDVDVTEVTVTEVLVARLARLTANSRRR